MLLSFRRLSAKTDQAPLNLIEDRVDLVDSAPEITWTGQGVILPGDSDPPGSLSPQQTMSDRRKLLVSGLSSSQEFQQGDEALIEGTWWRILGHKRLAPDGLGAILWTLWCEK